MYYCCFLPLCSLNQSRYRWSHIICRGMLCGSEDPCWPPRWDNKYTRKQASRFKFDADWSYAAFPCHYSPSSSTCVTPRRTTTSTAPVSVAITQCSGSCPNAGRLTSLWMPSWLQRCDHHSSYVMCNPKGDAERTGSSHPSLRKSIGEVLCCFFFSSFQISALLTAQTQPQRQNHVYNRSHTPMTVSFASSSNARIL